MEFTLDISSLLIWLGVVILFRREITGLISAITGRIQDGDAIHAEINDFVKVSIGQGAGDAKNAVVDAEVVVNIDPTAPGHLQLAKLAEHYRSVLQRRIGAKGPAGRDASLRKLALHALEEGKITAREAEALDRLDEFARISSTGRISPQSAALVVTASGTLLPDELD